MAKVTLLFGNDLQGEYNLDKPELTVGRSRDCDIHVDNLGVSRHHCSLIQADGGWKIVDKGSNNGTFVDGERVDERLLKDQDRVVLGKFSLVYDAHGQATEQATQGSSAAGAMGSEMTMFVDPEAIKQMQQKMAGGDGKAPTTEKTSAPRMVLAVRQGPREVNCALIKPETTIGKGIESDLPVKGLLVKPMQAKVVQVGSGFRLISLGGMRSVRVNGRKVNDHMLQPGDVIVIAGTQITFRQL
ncbi:MAG: FHA domain-containing protein [Planctomycetota bacterium]